MLMWTRSVPKRDPSPITPLSPSLDHGFRDETERVPYRPEPIRPPHRIEDCYHL